MHVTVIIRIVCLAKSRAIEIDFADGHFGGRRPNRIRGLRPAMDAITAADDNFFIDIRREWLTVAGLHRFAIDALAQKTQIALVYLGNRMSNR